MWPFICDGDIVVIHQGINWPYLGKVVAIFHGSQLIAHRIVWVYKKKDGDSSVWLQGDFSKSSIAKVKLNQVIGTVVQLERNNRILKKWFMPPWYFFAIPIAYLFRIWKILLKSPLFRTGIKNL